MVPYLDNSKVGLIQNISYIVNGNEMKAKSSSEPKLSDIQNRTLPLAVPHNHDDVDVFLFFQNFLCL